MSERRFVGQTVIVTGASAGIGLECGRRFAREGANVVLVARGEAELEKARAELASLGSVIAVAADVAEPDGPRKIIDAALAAFGAIQVLVNNAGAHARGPFADQEAEKLGKMVDVNLRAPIVLTSKVLPHIRKAGRGAVINVTSLAGMVPTVGSATYSATKFGLRAFTMALAEELVGTGITVSCVSPGPVDTQFIMADLDTVSDLTMSQPLVTADQIAELVVDCAVDGKVERTAPRLSGVLATLGYLVPGMRRALRPMLEARGRKNKERIRQRNA